MKKGTDPQKLSEVGRLRYTLHGQRWRLLDAVHDKARELAELAGWLRWRCPELWRQAGEEVAATWPGEVHPAVVELATHAAALRIAGLMSYAAERRALEPLEALEELRQGYRRAPGVYEIKRVGYGHAQLASLVTRSALGLMSDEHQRRESRLRAHRAGSLVRCGLGYDGHRCRTHKSRDGDAYAPRRAPTRQDSRQARSKARAEPG